MTVSYAYSATPWPTFRAAGGLYCLLPGVVTAFTGAVYTAWVLLVEIIRQRPR